MISRFNPVLKASLALAAGLLLNAATMETKADPRTTEATAGRTVNAENRPKNSLDFELSDGREFIRLSNLPPGLTVLNFWRADCPPCVREMPLLAEFAREGKARVITVALQRPAETLAAPAVVVAALNQHVLALNGPSEPRGLLARFGNPHGGLPHTVLLDAKRQTCAQRTGEVDEDWLRNALNRCTTYQGRP